jgi:hypothetical protein
MSISLYKIGALGTDDPTQLLQFQCLFVTGIDRVSHLRLPFQTSGYQVTTGKTLYIVKMLDMSSATIQAYYKLGYCDNDVGFDTLTARTNAVMSVGQDNSGSDGVATVATDTSAGNSMKNLEQATSLLKIAIATKFPFVRRVSTQVGASLLLWGVEL